MPNHKNHPSFRKDYLSLFMIGIIAVLVLGILAGTLWAFTSGSAQKAKNPGAATATAGIDNTTAIFKGLGVLRAITADEKPITVVISIFIPYKADDIAFQEELVQKKRVLRSAILQWFKVRPIAIIEQMEETEIKKQLINEINLNLILNQVQIIYFDEYMIL